ncbi:MAG TPA: ATP-binding protein [bacterium]|nr:ATP-binding protein [bacterium]
MKNVVGQVVTGEKFFNRKEDIRKLWEKIKSGSSVLLSAPRRTGKTSILYHIKDNPEEGYSIFYLDTESVDSCNEFFRKIYNHLLNESDEKLKVKIVEMVKSLGKKIEEVGKTIKLGDKELDYYEELVLLMKKPDFKDQKIVIIIDEFAQTLQNILKDDEKKAVLFLEKNRSLRQNPEINKNIQFIYAGSIGLENIAESIDGSKYINDINSQILKPLTKQEAKELITFILDGEQLINDEIMDYILQKLHEFVPYYIQIIIQEIHESGFSGTTLEIDRIFEEIVKKRVYFEHWHTRLKPYKSNEYKFAKKILNIASENEFVTSAVIYDKAVEFGVEEDYKAVVNALIYDGYINNDGKPSEYKFNSPLLKMWWCRNVAN